MEDPAVPPERNLYRSPSGRTVTGQTIRESYIGTRLKFKMGMSLTLTIANLETIIDMLSWHKI